MGSSLTLGEYQLLAARTDRTRQPGSKLDLPLLGLFGEVGSLLSEVKKKQRDTRSYLGYESSVVEEMGDVLWYLTIISDRADLTLSEIAANGKSDSGSISVQDSTFASLQPQQSLPLHTPTTAFERTLMRLAAQAGSLVNTYGEDIPQQSNINLRSDLASFFYVLIEAANEAGITLEQAANRNLEKTFDRWPLERKYPRLFDEHFPPEEQLPRSLTVDIFERVLDEGTPREKRYVIQRCNGILIGDRLTDNIMAPDDYRFHDVFHYGYAAILGWSPVTRALFRLKRKSDASIDEGQDSARAVLIEEGVATFLFGVAKQLDFFAGQERGDLSFTLLKTIRQFVAGYESQSCPLWLWEEAILSGNEAFRFLRERRRGRLQLDLIKHSLTIEELPS